MITYQVLRGYALAQPAYSYCKEWTFVHSFLLAREYCCSLANILYNKGASLSRILRNFSKIPTKNKRNAKKLRKLLQKKRKNVIIFHIERSSEYVYWL